MKYVAPLVFIILLMTGVYVGIAAYNLTFFFGILIPYFAFTVFLIGFVYKILHWASLPVPYRIPTTCGQAKSLDWIKTNELESPSSYKGVLGRMFLEVFLFRSLFRNVKAEMKPGPDLKFVSSKWLWLGAIVFHWALLIILIRHYRLFLTPVPQIVQLLENLDGFLQITLPAFYISNLLLVAAVTFLILRRYFSPVVRYLSLLQDYFPLYLIMAIALTGMLMRYFVKTDVVKVKELVQSLVQFRFEGVLGVSPLFYIHLFLVCLLALYFPFSKLMHMGGVFFSPTRNLANNSREKRHINPANPEIDIPSYGVYEEEFKEKMVTSGIPLDQD
ncbi:MAG: menaquinol oxidoreductase [Proteobacteria bacterium]|nr:menaquinol oxidoreductase [Pseudomonadota bacterium]